MQANDLPSTELSVDPMSIDHLTSESITHQTVVRYFETMNAGDFNATSALFATEGSLKAPFESPFLGREEIAAYLHREAPGMRLEPRDAISETLENDQTQIQVSGTVQTGWCGVNVSWLFVLNSEREIAAATIKLLASPQELLNMQKRE